MRQFATFAGRADRATLPPIERRYTTGARKMDPLVTASIIAALVWLAWKAIKIVVLATEETNAPRREPRRRLTLML
jgi:hypothetical protein